MKVRAILGLLALGVTGTVVGAGWHMKDTRTCERPGQVMRVHVDGMYGPVLCTAPGTFVVSYTATGWHLEPVR